MESLEERKKLANAEMWEVVRWFNTELDRIDTELDVKLGSARTLDGNRKAFAETHKEFARRMMVIGEKYNLPPATNK